MPIPYWKLLTSDVVRAAVMAAVSVLLREVAAVVQERLRGSTDFDDHYGP